MTPSVAVSIWILLMLLAGVAIVDFVSRHRPLGSWSLAKVEAGLVLFRNEHAVAQGRLTRAAWVEDGVSRLGTALRLPNGKWLGTKVPTVLTNEDVWTYNVDFVVPGETFEAILKECEAFTDPSPTGCPIHIVRAHGLRGPLDWRSFSFIPLGALAALRPSASGMILLSVAFGALMTMLHVPRTFGMLRVDPDGLALETTWPFRRRRKFSWRSLRFRKLDAAVSSARGWVGYPAIEVLLGTRRFLFAGISDARKGQFHKRRARYLMGRKDFEELARVLDEKALNAAA